MPCGQADYLHSERAAAAGYPFVAQVLLDGSCKCQHINTGMVLKALIFKCDDALFKFIGHLRIIREAPLTIWCYGCAQQSAAAII